MLSRSTLWRIAIGIIAVAILVPVGRWASDVYHYRSFLSEFRTISLLLNKVQDSPPPQGCSDHDWVHAWGWLLSCNGNICGLPDSVSREDLRKLRIQIAADLATTPTIDTAEKIWNRYRNFSAYGKRYTDQFEQEFREYCDAARADIERHATRRDKLNLETSEAVAP